MPAPLPSSVRSSIVIVPEPAAEPSSTIGASAGGAAAIVVAAMPAPASVTSVSEGLVALTGAVYVPAARWTTSAPAVVRAASSAAFTVHGAAALVQPGPVPPPGAA